MSLNKIAKFTQKFSLERRKILGNTAWLLASRILQMGISMLVGIWVARYLGPKNFGLLNYALAFCGLFTPLIKLGLDEIVIRDLVREPQKKNETLGTTFLLKLLSSIAVFFLSIALISLIRSGESIIFGLVVILASKAIFESFDTIDFWFRSQIQSKYTVIARNTAFLLATGVKICLIQIGASLTSFAWVVWLQSFLSAVGIITAYVFKGNSIDVWKWRSHRAKYLLQQGWPLILSGFAISIYMKVDILMLGEIAGEDAVGMYSAAVKLSESWYFIAGSFVSSAFPAILAAKEVNEAIYYGKLQKLFNFLNLLAYGISLPMTILSGKLVLTLYGENYEMAGTILSIHIWASVFVFMGLVQTPWNIAEGLTKLYLQRTMLGAIINVILNFLLIPIYSGIGAALATVFSYGFASFLLNAFDSRTRKLFVLQAKALTLTNWNR